VVFIRLVPSCDVAIKPDGDTLRLRVPTGEEFDILEVFGEILMNAVIDQVRLFGQDCHVPRITVDQMVLVRETWRFSARDLAFAAERDEAARYVRVRDWRRTAGLPRRVFVTVVGEKPLYVDFDSPLYVRLFTKAVRKCAEGDESLVTVVEMLPEPEQMWLTDAAGRRYSSELRLVASDLQGEI
jgi:hypothetical protein